MREDERISRVLNRLTVEEFLEIYPENIQGIMSEIGYYVDNGLIYIGNRNAENNDLAK